MSNGADDISDMDSADGFEDASDDEEDDMVDIRGLVGDNKRKGKASTPDSNSPPANKSRKRE